MVPIPNRKAKKANGMATRERGIRSNPYRYSESQKFLKKTEAGGTGGKGGSKEEKYRFRYYITYLGFDFGSR